MKNTTTTSITTTTTTTRKIARCTSSSLSGEDSILAASGASSTSSSGASNKNNGNGKTSGFGNTKKFGQMLTFIQGATVGSRRTRGGENDDDGSDGCCNDGEHEEEETQKQHAIPTMQSVAEESGNTLDTKQYLAYQIICASFLLQLIYESGNTTTNLWKYFHAVGMEDSNDHDSNFIAKRNELVTKLNQMGGEEQLRMLLTGPGGCGKSTCIKTAQEFAHKFCMGVAMAFNDYTFYFTSTTGSSAALFGGTTIHSAAHLNKTRITETMRTIWLHDVRILVIDEISFFQVSNIEKLDKHLKRLTGRNDLPYGGVSIIFSGDFHQLKPIGKEEEVLSKLQ